MKEAASNRLIVSQLNVRLLHDQAPGLLIKTTKLSTIFGFAFRTEFVGNQKMRTDQLRIRSSEFTVGARGFNPAHKASRSMG